MKKVLFWAVIIAFLTGAFLSGSRYGRQQALQKNSSEVKSLPASIEKESGEQPGDDLSSLPPGTVGISPERQQMIGVRIRQVVRRPEVYAIRLLGRVVADETRIYRVNAAVDGWVQKVAPATTGSIVKKDQWLASFYSPEFLSAMQAYIYALNSLDRFQASAKETPEQIELTRVNVQQYVDSLRNLGMPDVQIEELKHTRKYTENIMIVSPVAGLILLRNLSPGERFVKGTELFRIVDLSRVWIVADMFENESRYFKPRVIAKVTLPYQRKNLKAVVSNVPPIFDPASRTLKIRLETANPGDVLRPDMFVDVELPVNIPASIAVPADAIINSGMKKTVFVDRGNGYFEPRNVETGMHFGDRIEVIKGLKPGEKIVVSGNFLIDSESKLRGVGLGSPQSATPEEPPAGGGH